MTFTTKFGGALAVLAGLAVGGAAHAADLPARTAPVEPLARALPIFTWTGFYVGLNGGYIFETGKSTITGSPAFQPLGPSGSLKTIGEGFTFGGTVGYNYQVGQFVAGLEADLNYVDLGKSVVTNIGGIVTTVSQGPTYLGTVRGRLGFAIDNVLIYATGGLAYGDQDASTTVNGAGRFWSGSKNDTRFGYALGAGMEYAFTRNWSAKLEYLYYDLGKVNYTSPLVAGAALPGVFATTKAENRGNIVRAGINYRF